MWWALVAAKLAVDIQLSKYCGLARLVSSTPYISIVIVSYTPIVLKDGGCSN
jgi:hypothetical protein